MNHDDYSDDYLRGLLRRVRIVAMVGASPNWNRPSYFAMKYLQDKGFRVIPVNPQAAGQTILGEPVIADLAALPPGAIVPNDAGAHTVNPVPPRVALTLLAGMLPLFASVTVTDHFSPRSYQASPSPVTWVTVPWLW